METTARELNQRTAQVLARVEAGETVTVTENGHPVAVLRPYGPEDPAAYPFRTDPMGMDDAPTFNDDRGHGPPAAGAIVRYVAGRVAAGRSEVPGIGQLLLAAHAVLSDCPGVGLADAMNVVLAREFRTDVIATFDQRHFRMIRPLTPHSNFRLLPDDVPS
jgi:prevent-host-death family protein